MTSSSNSTQSQPSFDPPTTDVEQQASPTTRPLLQKSTDGQTRGVALPRSENLQGATTPSDTMLQRGNSCEGQQHIEQESRPATLELQSSQIVETSRSGYATPTAASSPAINFLAQELQSVQPEDQSQHISSDTTRSEHVQSTHSSVSQTPTLVTGIDFEGVSYPSAPEIEGLRRNLLRSRARSTSDLQALSLACSLKESAQRSQNLPRTSRYDELDPSSLFESEGLQRREQHTYTEWAADMAWRYLDPEESIETFSYPIGVLAYRRCPTMRPMAHEFNPRQETHGGHYDAPAIVMDADSGSQRTHAVYDQDLNLFRIWRPREAIMDLRSCETHPDCLPDRKLCEYQAVEILDYETWRTDRSFFHCRLPRCQMRLVDHNTTTVLCLGCGPQTNIRYCSREHQLEDLVEH